jgi:hypothetical protein
MAVTTLPAPLQNFTAAGMIDRATDVVTSSTIRVVAGDFTGGASEDLFTLTAHGLVTGDVVHVLWQSAMGGVTGGEGLRCYIKKVDADTFHLASDQTGATVIENTADATVVLLKGDLDSAFVRLGIIPNIIVDAWDFTGGTVEDQGTPAQGMKGLYEADTMKLLYKSAAGVTAGTLDATYYCKSPTVTYHQISATSGGAVVDSTADGTAVFLKTS